MRTDSCELRVSRRAGIALEPLGRLTEHPSEAVATFGWGARTMMKDAASTDVIVHRGMALASFYQCGDLHQLEPRTLDDLGRADWNGRFPADGVSAHPKVDEHTGELLFFNYSTEAPFMHYGVVDRDGALTNYVDVPLPGPRLPHDMAFTENWSILCDFPLFWDPTALADGFYRNAFDRDLPSRFALIPRARLTDDIRWFEADPTFVLHFTNAYEDGDTWCSTASSSTIRRVKAYPEPRAGTRDSRRST